MKNNDTISADLMPLRILEMAPKAADETIIKQLMDLDPPVKSLLEQDLYKYSMSQLVLHKEPSATVRVTFKCRSEEKVGFLKPVVDLWIDHLCTLRFSDDEIKYLRSIPWLSADFCNWLRRLYLFRDQIHTGVDTEGQLVMWAEGPWVDVIWFEVPCLAIVEEAYQQYKLREYGLNPQDVNTAMVKKLVDKVDRYNKARLEMPFTVAEFGMRRRFSADWQDHVVGTLASSMDAFAGTSNVYLAKKYGVKPCGTMAHEIYMGLEGCGIQLRNVQREAWRMWNEEFRGSNGIMLTDIFGFRACLRDLDWYAANSFQGFRHDSGDPIQWGEMLIDKLLELHINPLTKTAVWSDCLNTDKALEILKHFDGSIKVSFGIGTDLVCDVPEPLKPLSIVMKLTHANGEPVLKLSDSPGKGMCPDPSLVEYAKHVYEYDPLLGPENDGRC